jgi:hypothetical protein
MRTFIARTGGFLLLILAALCLTGRLARAEGEVADGSYSSDQKPDIGLGLFTRFPIKVSASVTGGYDDNINDTNIDRQESWFVNASLVLHCDITTPRTTLALSTTTGFDYYFNGNTNTQYEPNLNLKLDLTHRASPRLIFDASAYIAYQTQPDFSSGLGTNRKSGNFFLTEDQLGVLYVWLPRFSTHTSYHLAAVQYEDISAGMLQDRIENTFGNEFRFLIWPTTNLVAEYRLQLENYPHFSERNSTANIFLGGIDQQFSPRLSFNFRAGAELVHYQDIGDQDSPYFESTLTYKLGKDTTASWINSYSITGGQVATNPTSTTFRTGLTGQHNLTARVSATLAIFYSHDDYDAFQSGAILFPAFTENTFDANISLRYAVNHYLGIQLGYDHTEVTSGEAIREYSKNRVWGGLNVSF